MPYLFGNSQCAKSITQECPGAGYSWWNGQSLSRPRIILPIDSYRLHEVMAFWRRVCRSRKRFWSGEASRKAGKLPAVRLAGRKILRVRERDIEAVLEPVDPADFN